MFARSGSLDRRRIRLPCEQCWTEYVLDLAPSLLISPSATANSRPNQANMEVSWPDYTVPALAATLPEINETFNTNLFAVMHICATFSPLLIRSRGTIIQIGSLAGIIPYVFGSVYNASKAALHSYSDTLRVELAPFGVNVMTVVTGGVKSNIARTERTLPEGSPYAAVEVNYQRRQKHSQEVGMNTEQYAREVVGKILAGDGWIWKRRTIWAGGSATLVRWIILFLGIGSGFWDWIMTRMFGLGVLNRKKDLKKER